jgi:hypothetical protein
MPGMPSGCLCLAWCQYAMDHVREVELSDHEERVNEIRTHSQPRPRHSHCTYQSMLTPIVDLSLTLVDNGNGSQSSRMAKAWFPFVAKQEL